MNWRRAGLISIAAIAALAACAALTLHVLVDPERLKGLAADKARSAWERELLMGEVSFHLLPVPSVRASQVSLANPDWAKDPHLLQAEQVRADLEILPLFFGKVRIKSLSLDGVKAALEVADDGAVSWQLKEGASKDPAQGAEKNAENPLQIASVNIRNARITHRAGREPSEPWTIEEATIDSEPGLKDVHIAAKLNRHGTPLEIKAELADLAHLGTKGATTEGRLDATFARTELHVQGKLPLDRRLQGLDLAANLKAASMDEVFGFFGVKRNKSAPLEMKLRARDESGRVQVSDFTATLGALKVSGDASIAREPRLTIHARLKAARIDWRKTLVDAGGEVKPRRHDGEVFHEDRVAWGAVSAVGKLHGTAELDIASLKLGNGLELANLRTKASFGDERLEMSPFTTGMLGGTAHGALRFDGRAKAVRFELDGEGLLLERWFHERGNKVPFTGGPMKVDMKLNLAGATYRELAASVTGRLAARMGKGVWDSQRASEAEEIMVRALQPKDSQNIQFQCAAIDLNFKSGKASGRNLLGARSDVSQLLTSGHVDFRDEAIDLRGKIISRSGIGIGLASLAGDVQITGKLAKPAMRLDPDAKPAILARAGAAIASAGVTLLGSALMDVAESQNDPCEQVGR